MSFFGTLFRANRTTHLWFHRCSVRISSFQSLFLSSSSFHFVVPSIFRNHFDVVPWLQWFRKTPVERCSEPPKSYKWNNIFHHFLFQSKMRDQSTGENDGDGDVTWRGSASIFEHPLCGTNPFYIPTHRIWFHGCSHCCSTICPRNHFVCHPTLLHWFFFCFTFFWTYATVLNNLLQRGPEHFQRLSLIIAP